MRDGSSRGGRAQSFDGLGGPVAHSLAERNGGAAGGRCGQSVQLELQLGLAIDEAPAEVIHDHTLGSGVLEVGPYNEGR